MNTFGAVSYGSAAAAFLVLTLLLLTSWQGRAAGVRLIVAAAMTAVWAAGMAWHAWDRSLPLIAVFTLELLRDGAWIVVLASLAQGILPRQLRLAAQALWVGLLLAGWILALLQANVVIDDGPGMLLAPGGLAIALVVLALLEQVYRNANTQGRYGFKFLAIGLGAVFAYDLFLYSQAELLRAISEDIWLARGFVNALLVPFIALAARRNPQWSLDVFVSRQVVLFTTAVVAVGVYLLLMAVGGYYLRQVGGSWGTTANIVFLAGALIVLTIVVMSGTVRRRLRVFISKHFYRNKYDYRIEWLRFVETLSGGGDEDVRRTSLRAMAQVLESPGGVMYVAGKNDQQFIPVAAWPMWPGDLPELGPVPSSHDMTGFLANRQWVIDVEEHAAAPEVYQNLEIPASLRSMARLRTIVPLMQQQSLTGFVLLLAPPPPFELTYEDRDLLKTLGRHVATLVAQHEADKRLAESRQFEAYHRLTAFMMHDLKNSAAQLQLVLRNAEKHKHNPEFIDDTIETISNAVERMNRLIEQLRDSGRRPADVTVDVVGVLKKAVQRCSDREPAPTLKPPANAQVRADPERLASAIEHVIRNAQDACTPTDRVTIQLRVQDKRAVISIADTGPGMSQEFLRDRLFRPFDSTKGSKGMGIGAYQAREYVRSLGGDVEVQSSPGSGTCFDINLPLMPALSPQAAPDGGGASDVNGHDLQPSPRMT